MSRFRDSRWAVSGVWTGAAVAWGTTAVVARQAAQPQPEEPPVVEPAPVSVEHLVEPALPAAPADGLVVLRYTPSSEPEPEVVTRYVESRPAPTVQASPASPAPAPTPAPPAPRSGGS
jgi:hypothetical protein